MAILTSNFIPELWSEAILEQFKMEMVLQVMKRASKGTRLLRAAARGASQEEIDEIDAGELNYTSGEIRELMQEYQKEAAKELATKLDSDILDAMRYSIGMSPRP